jgi:Xaa-Pro aminopeptidase
MTDILIYGDTIRSPELRHEIPLTVPDPFLYAERNGERHVYVSSLEVSRVRDLDGLVVHPYEDVGWDELVASGVHREEIYKPLVLNAVKDMGIEAATVPSTFPLELADHLRANGVDLTPEREHFSRRRRVKNEAEIAGMRRAQRACEAALDAARELLRAASPNESGGLEVDGKPLTSEWLKRRIGEVFTEHDMLADEFIVAHGPQSAVGHNMGSGQIKAGEPIIIDLWPRDRETGCYADMTRTYVVGEPPAPLVEFHRLVREALEKGIQDIRAGVPGRELMVGTCNFFQQHGYRTPLSKEPGEVLEDGFIHGLGHGVGLEVHEEPGMGIASHDPLVAGDVVTVEPGLYNPGFGGCRLEDMVLVTENGAENLTDYPYDLEP